MKRIVFISLVTLLVGCGSFKKRSVENLVKSESLQDKDFYETLAKVPDFPDEPLQVVIKSITPCAQCLDGIQVLYDYGCWSKAEIESFYRNEMERQGWSLDGVCNGKDIILLFIKPSGRVCMVSLRDVDFMICMMRKEESL